jgi:hypothetical protein
MVKWSKYGLWSGVSYYYWSILRFIPCLGCILAMVVINGDMKSVSGHPLEHVIGGILATLVSYAVSFLLAFVLGGNLLAELYELLMTLVPTP